MLTPSELLNLNDVTVPASTVTVPKLFVVPFCTSNVPPSTLRLVMFSVPAVMNCRVPAFTFSVVIVFVPPVIATFPRPGLVHGKRPP